MGTELSLDFITKPIRFSHEESKGNEDGSEFILAVLRSLGVQIEVSEGGEEEDLAEIRTDGGTDCVMIVWIQRGLPSALSSGVGSRFVCGP